MNEINTVTSDDMSTEEYGEFDSFYGWALFIKTPEERFANKEGERRKEQEMISCMREKGFSEEQIFDIFGKSGEMAEPSAEEEDPELKKLVEEASLDEFSRISYARREGAQRKEQEIYNRMLENGFISSQLREIFLNDKGTLVILHKMTPEEKAREIERVREKTLLDWNSAINFAGREGEKGGEQRGEQIGRQKEREEAIARMRETGFTEEQIRMVY